MEHEFETIHETSPQIVVLRDDISASESKSDDDSNDRPNSAAIEAAFAEHPIVQVDTLPKVMIALARGAETLLLACRKHDTNELLSAVKQYYSKVAVLRWYWDRREPELLAFSDGASETTTGENSTPTEETAALRGAVDNTMTSRALVTKEELALLIQPLALDEASGEEGRESP